MAPNDGVVGTLPLYRESSAETAARGKKARRRIPRERLGEHTPVDRDPVAIITGQNATRLPHLVPLRHARMASSPYSFFRGAAALMAFDLSHQEQTGAQVVISGDAHINNFGLYASPERRLVFDLNDFDEAAPGPWEWDVKRLLTSAVLAAQENGLSKTETNRIVRNAARTYRTNLEALCSLPALQRLYVSVDSTVLAENVREEGVKKLNKVTRKALHRDSDRAIQHLMGPDEGGDLRFLEQPPILTKVEDRVVRDLEFIFSEYRDSTTPDIAYFLSQYTMTDVALRVVGVGSVGTRCYLVALSGPEGDGIILQAKEATQSVVMEHSDPNVTTPPTLRPGMPAGERVVAHQRILQAVSDPFLGHMESASSAFYVRQYRDAKGSFDTTQMNADELTDYVALCANLLSRAHSQSPMAHWIVGYLGDSDVFDKAMVKWANAYAKQSNEDFEAFKEAVASGKIEAASTAGG